MSLGCKGKEVVEERKTIIFTETSLRFQISLL
jgi:hypothetical protein